MKLGACFAPLGGKMQKTGELSISAKVLAAAFLFAVVALIPIKAEASDLTWNTSEGLGLLAGKTVGNGKTFEGKHNNNSYPDNFTIEFKYFDSEGNVQTSDATCSARKGASFSMKVNFPIEHTEFKCWQVVSATNQLTGANPVVRVVLTPIGKNGEAIFTSAKGSSKSEETASEAKSTGSSKASTRATSASSTETGNESTAESSAEASEDSSSETVGHYLDPLWDALNEAAQKGEPATVYWSEGNGLPYNLLLFIKENPNITLVFSYHYEGKDYKITIPGDKVDLGEYVPWYGPINLYGRYWKY